MSTKEFDKYQLSLMKHTVGGHDRNWFGTSDSTKDCCAFNDLVDKGYATRRTAPSFWGDDWVFSLTEKGIQAVKEEEKPLKPVYFELTEYRNQHNQRRYEIDAIMDNGDRQHQHIDSESYDRAKRQGLIQAQACNCKLRDKTKKGAL